MAEVAISQLTGEHSAFQGADMSAKLKLLGVDAGSIGDSHGKTPDAIAYTFSDEREEVYKRLIVSADGKTALGAVLVGDCSRLRHPAAVLPQWHRAARPTLKP